MFSSLYRLLTFHTKGIGTILVRSFVAMFFIIFKKPIFLLSKVFIGLVIQGGSRGTNLLVSFGMKLDMTFKNNISKSFDLPISVRVKIQVLKPREIGHTIFDGSRVRSIKMPNLSITR